MKKRLVLGLLALFVVMLSGCKKEAGTIPQTAYAHWTVGNSEIETMEKYSATFRGRQDVEIIPQISGKITSVNVREGQKVKKGQTLFVIDQVPYKASFQTAKANLQSAKATVASARLDYEGKKELLKAKVISDFELQKSYNAFLIAEAACEQAEAAVTTARNELSYTIVSSPCDGVIGTLPYRAGSLVSPEISTPLTTVSDNSEMYVYFSIPENRMINLIRQHGSVEKVLDAMPKVKLFLNDGSDYTIEGHIESISGVLEKNTGSVSLKAVFKNPDGLLHSGGSGNIGLTEKKSDVIVIPQAATYELQDKVYAYRVIDGKTKSVMLDVKSLPEQKQYLVLSGLKVGDVIITEGVGNLQDGMKIQLK